MNLRSTCATRAFTIFFTSAAGQIQSESLEIAVFELRSTMQHNLEHTISLLTRTPAALNALLRDLRKRGRSEMKVKILGARSTSSAI